MYKATIFALVLASATLLATTAAAEETRGILTSFLGGVSGQETGQDAQSATARGIGGRRTKIQPNNLEQTGQQDLVRDTQQQPQTIVGQDQAMDFNKGEQRDRVAGTPEAGLIGPTQRALLGQGGRGQQQQQRVVPQGSQQQPGAYQQAGQQTRFTDFTGQF